MKIAGRARITSRATVAATAARAFAALVLLFAVNMLLSLHRILPSANIALGFLPAPELLLVFAPVIASAALQRRYERTAGYVGAALGALLVGYSLGEGAIRLLYARAWEPVADYPLLRGGVLLLFPGDGTSVDIAVIAVVLVTLSLLTAVLVALIRSLIRLLRALAHTGPGVRPLAAATGVILSVMVIGIAATGTGHTLSARIAEAVRGDDFVLRSVGQQANGEESTTEAVYDAPGLRDRDIYVFIVESYGITIFEREEIRQAVLPKLEEFGSRLEHYGFHGVSNFLEAPIFGGQSWLAEATFLTGNRIDRQGRYERLIEEGSNTLPRALSEIAEYYSVAVKPGNINAGWDKEQAVFGFDEVLSPYDGDFGYEGPWFSFVPIPDQYAIWTAHERIHELRKAGGDAADRPLYLHYQLVSSHLPFNRIPEVIEDWQTLGDGSLYHESENQYFDNTYISGEEYVEGFSASINYVLEVIAQYMTRYVPENDESLFIIYGDHQPGTMVTGHDASHSVPVHIVSRDRELLETWKENHGYTSGFFPDQSYPHKPMEDMFPTILEIAGGRYAKAVGLPTGVSQ